MSKFRYIAVDGQDKKVEGLKSANNAEDLESMLLSEGLSLLWCYEERLSPW